MENCLLRGHGRAGVGEAIVDDDEAVGIRACVAVAADSGGDGPDRGGAITVDAAFDIAQAIGCGAQGRLVAALVPVG